MFARLTRAQVRVDRIDKFINRYKESVVPAAKVQKGYQGAYLLIDRNTGRGLSMSFWDSEEDALANEKSRYYQEQVAKFINFYTQSPIREGYEVIVKA